MRACFQQACGISFSGSKICPVAEDSALQVSISASVVLSDSTLGHQFHLDIHKASFIMQKYVYILFVPFLVVHMTSVCKHLKVKSASLNYKL